MTNAPPPPPLPGVLAGIEEIAGRDAALRVAEELGGTRIYIPKGTRAVRRRDLSRQIGADALSALADLRGGEELEVPRARRAIIHHLAFIDPQPTNVIARRAAMSERKVRQAIQLMRAEADQMDLFGVG